MCGAVASFITSVVESIRATPLAKKLACCRMQGPAVTASNCSIRDRAFLAQQCRSGVQSIGQLRFPPTGVVNHLFEQVVPGVRLHLRSWP